MHDWSGLWNIWFSPADIEREAHYWPVVYTSFWIEHKLWGLAPLGYHAVNVLLHLVNVLLIWRLLGRLAVPGAWIVAAVFAVHPLHVESVAWVIERKDVLSALFYLTAAGTWIRFTEAPQPRRYLLALGLFTAGLLSKSVVVTLPAALLIWHWWQTGRITRTDVTRLVPFFAVALAVTAADLAFYASREPARSRLPGRLAERFLRRGARAVVLRGQAALADRSHRDLPALGDQHRGPRRLDVRPGGGGPGRPAVVRAAAARAGAVGGRAVLRRYAVAGARFRRLRLHAVLAGGRPLPVPGRPRGAGGACRRRRPRGRLACRPARGGWRPGGSPSCSRCSVRRPGCRRASTGTGSPSSAISSPTIRTRATPISISWLLWPKPAGTTRRSPPPASASSGVRVERTPTWTSAACS